MVENINQGTNVRSLAFKFEIQFDGSGYLLLCSSLDDSLYADTWHSTQDEAEQVALQYFGIGLNEWKDK